MIKHLHFLFASILMLAFGVNASAQDVKFDFTPADSYTMFGLKGVSYGNDVKDGDITGEASVVLSDVTLTVKSGTGQANRIWKASKGNELRTYKGGSSITIKSAKNIAKVTFVGKKINFKTTDGTVLSNDSKEWTASAAANTVEFETTNTTNIESITVTLGEGGGDVNPTPGEAKELYSILFNTQENIDSWTVEGPLKDIAAFKTLRNNESMALVNNNDHISENIETSYVVSPVITLGENNVASFNNAAFNGSNGNMTLEELFGLAVRTENGEWTELKDITFSDNWKTFVNSGEIKVPAEFNGKKVQFAFRFTGDGNNNIGQLFIKDFKVLSNAAAPEPTETIAENIAAFKALCTKDGAEVTLQLKDVKVLYVNEWESKGKAHQKVYVKDATGALMFYEVGLVVKDGDVLNGSIKGNAKDHYGTLEFVKNANTDMTTVTAVAGDKAVAETRALNEITKEDISNLIAVDNVKMIAKDEEDSKGKIHTNYYMVDAEGVEFIFDNKFKIEGLNGEIFLDALGSSFTGIIGYSYEKLEFYPISLSVPTGIDCTENAELDVNAPMYNVAGQKVNANYKGIVLQNGKKFFNK